jgi:bacterioferritin-associated ferredoxin
MPGGLGETDCYSERDKFIQICDLSIRRGSAYMAPHYACCLTVRTYDMVCICRSITDQNEKTIDARKAYFVSRDCRKPVHAGNKCGSKCLRYY